MMFSLQSRLLTILSVDKVAKHFISVFERVNNALEADKSIDSSLSGTTAVSGDPKLLSYTAINPEWF